MTNFFTNDHDFSIVLLQKTPMIKKAEYVLPEKEAPREPMQIISKKDLAQPVKTAMQQEKKIKS